VLYFDNKLPQVLVNPLIRVHFLRPFTYRFDVGWILADHILDVFLNRGWLDITELGTRVTPNHLDGINSLSQGALSQRLPAIEGFRRCSRKVSLPFRLHLTL
jgi:hypothetical protein